MPYYEKEYVKVEVMQEKIVPIVTEVVKLERAVEFCDRIVDRIV